MSRLLRALEGGIDIYDLGQPLEPRMPVSPNHPGFRMALLRRHGDHVRPDGSSAANELLVTGGHVGTHVDALAHVSLHDRLYGGASASAAQRGGRFTSHGIDTMAPFVGRGVLLDVAAATGVDCLQPGQAVTAGDCERAAEWAGVEVRPGDGVLVRTGWARCWNDPATFVGLEHGAPGPDESAARWLAELGVSLTGGETVAYEQIPRGQGHALLPVHVLLLVEHGIPIVEMLDLGSLSTDGVYEFLLVMTPLKIVGGTGSPVRPLALVSE
jgi:kynurenine formamidase